MTNMMAIEGLDRERLTGLAYRMLGTVADAEDAVQEAFVRWYRLDEGARIAVLNPAGWFAKTTSRICLDILKSASRRRNLYIGPWLPEPIPDARYQTRPQHGTQDPAEHVSLAQSVSIALLTIMEKMSPAERVAFILRDVFDYSSADIAEVLGRSPGAVRQLCSSARSRLPALEPTRDAENAQLTAAFLHAASTGNTAALLELLAPDVKLCSDGGGIARAALNPIHGPNKVARFILGVLERQAGTVLALHENSSGSTLAFENAGIVGGVLEIVTHAGAIHDVLIQWNPQKLTLWRAT